MRWRKDPRRRLATLRDDAERLRQRLAVLDQQLAYQQGVADEAAARAAGSESPLAAREQRAADEDVRRTRRERREVAERLDDILGRQDELLERLAERAAPERGGDR